MDPTRNLSAGIRAAASPSSIPEWVTLPRVLITVGLIVSAGLLFGGLYGQQDNSPVQTGLSIAGGVGLFIVLVIMFLRSDIGKGLYTGSAVGGNTSAIILILIVTILGFVLVFAPYGAGTKIDPYLGALIGVISSILIGVVLIVLYKYSSRIQAANVVSRMTLILSSFLPYALITFGPLVDIITQKLQFTPASIVGISSIFINWMISTILNGGTTTTPTSIFCEIPGLALFSSNIVPQPMMATLSMIAYIATYASRSSLSGTVKNPTISFTNDPNKIWPLWVLYGALAGSYAAAFTFREEPCIDFWTGVRGMIIPAIYGGVFGVLGFEFLAPRYDAAIAASSTPPILGGSGTTTPTVGTCEAGSSDGEFICESFENGQLKTRTITE